MGTEGDYAAYLFQAIKTKMENSLFIGDVSGRVFYGKYDDSDPITYPHAIYNMISSDKEKTFTETYYNILLQFSLLSIKTLGMVEITSMYNHLSSLFDECELNITDHRLIWMRESACVSMTDIVDALPDGSNEVHHWSVDFDVKIQKN